LLSIEQTIVSDDPADATPIVFDGR